MHYLLSTRLVQDRTLVFAEAIRSVISGVDGFFRTGDVLEHMTLLIRDGTPFDSHYHTEVGRWDRRFSCEHEAAPGPASADTYYAWVDPDYWDYDPHCVLYTKAEFMELLADCCRNYVAAHPDRREEFAQAMAANGMTL